MITRTDNFDRASLGSGYTQNGEGGTMEIYNSAEVVHTGDNQDGNAFWNADTCHADQRAQLTLAAEAGGSHLVGPSVRAVGGAVTYCAFYTSGGSEYCFTYVNGTASVKYSQTIGRSVGDVLKLEWVGTALKAWVNGGNVLDTTSSDIASGQVGVAGGSTAGGPYTGTRGDNWEASWEGTEGGPRVGVRFESRLRPAHFMPGNAR